MDSRKIVNEHKDLVYHVLHRMVSASVTEQASSVPEGFDLKAYVQQDRALEFPLGPAALPLVASVERAQQLWRSQKDWRVRVLAGMQRDDSWNGCGRRYARLFQRLLPGADA